VGSGVLAADADVVEAAAGAQGDGSGLADAVGADAVVGVGAAVAGGCLGAGRVGGGGRGVAGQGLVRALVVVVAGEGVEEGLELGEVGGLGALGGEPLLEGLLESFDFALSLGWLGLPFFCVTPRRRSSCSRALRPPLPPDSRVVKTMPLCVEAGAPWAAAAARNAARTAGPVTRSWAVADRAYREWSSSQVRISVPVLSASG